MRYNLNDVSRFEDKIVSLMAEIQRKKTALANIRESLANAKGHAARGETLASFLPEDTEILVTEFGLYATVPRSWRVPQDFEDVTSLNTQEIAKFFTVHRYGNLTVYRKTS